MPLEDIRKAQDLRDAQDRDRPIGALAPAADALVISSDGMTPAQVVDQIVDWSRQRR